MMNTPNNTQTLGSLSFHEAFDMYRAYGRPFSFIESDYGRQCTVFGARANDRQHGGWTIGSVRHGWVAVARPAEATE